MLGLCVCLISLLMDGLLLVEFYLYLSSTYKYIFWRFFKCSLLYALHVLPSFAFLDDIHR